MPLDLIAFLNHEVGLFGIDQLWVRAGIFGLVAAAAFAWPRRLRSLWPSWSANDRFREATVFVAVALYGVLAMAAAQREDPLRVITWLIVLVFVALNVAAYSWREGRDH